MGVQTLSRRSHGDVTRLNEVSSFEHFQQFAHSPLSLYVHALLYTLPPYEHPLGAVGAAGAKRSNCLRKIESVARTSKSDAVRHFFSPVFALVKK